MVDPNRFAGAEILQSSFPDDDGEISPTLAAALMGDGDGVVEVDRLAERIAAAPEALGIRFSAGEPTDHVAAVLRLA